MSAFAEELVGALGTAQSLATFTSRDASFDVARGYEVAAELHAARVARGEQPVGRKIGFTNRNIWDEYGVREPIWGYVYDTTLFRPRGGHASAAIGEFTEPRIEPEIVLHFKSAPPATRDEAGILDCIDWIAHGFEIVQSPFPGWKFKAADTIAANGLHGMLVVGDPVPVASIPESAVLHVSPGLTGSAAVSVPVVTSSPAATGGYCGWCASRSTRYASARSGEPSTFAPRPRVTSRPLR